MTVSIREIHQKLCYGAGGPSIDEPTMSALQYWHDSAMAEWLAAEQPALPTSEDQDHETTSTLDLLPFTYWLLSCSPLGKQWIMASSDSVPNLSHDFWLKCALFTEVYNAIWEFL